MASTSGIFSSVASILNSAGQSSLIPSVFAQIGTALNTTKSQVTARLNSLAELCNNPPAYAAAAPAIITQIEGVANLPAGVIPLLETLRSATDPLKVAQTIQAIEAQL